MGSPSHTKGSLGDLCKVSWSKLKMWGKQTKLLHEKWCQILWTMLTNMAVVLCAQEDNLRFSSCRTLEP